MGMFDGIGTALTSGLLSVFGGERRNTAQAEQAQQANAFSAQQFASRYQTTVKDMEAAGLNPMLAYSQGGGSPPSGQQAQMQDTITPGVESFNRTRSTAAQNAVQNAQVKNIEADTENKQAQANLTKTQDFVLQNNNPSVKSAIDASARASLAGARFNSAQSWELEKLNKLFEDTGFNMKLTPEMARMLLMGTNQAAGKVSAGGNGSGTTFVWEHQFNKMAADEKSKYVRDVFPGSKRVIYRLK